MPPYWKYNKVFKHIQLDDEGRVIVSDPPEDPSLILNKVPGRGYPPPGGFEGAQARNRIKTLEGLAEFDLQGLCKIKASGHFDHFLDRELCQGVVNSTLRLSAFDIDARRHFVRRNVLNFKFVGYSARGLRSMIDDDLIYDAESFAESKDYRDLIFASEFKYFKVYKI